MRSVINLVPQTSTSFAGRLRNRFSVTGRLVRAVMRNSVDATLRNEMLGRLLEYEEYASLMSFVARPPKSHTIDASSAAPFPLLVTTNKGLFLFHGAHWRCLLPVTCFGLARDGDTLYLGASAGIHSFVLAARISSGPESCVVDDVRILTRYETRYHNERIHQIAFDPRTREVICANSRRNSLLVLNPESGEIIDEKFLFVDGTGFPVYTDQNHINSVTPYGEVVLFTVHSAGENGGALGFVAADRVRAYRYDARGVHDIMIHEGGIMFTDSFRDAIAASQPDINGAVRFRGEYYQLDATDSISPKIVLRGLASCNSVLTVGYSAFASRKTRRSVDAGTGGIIVICPDGKSAAVDGPFSQVYDILPFNGARSDRAGTPRSEDELDKMFYRDVGPLLYDAPVVRGARISELR